MKRLLYSLSISGLLYGCASPEKKLRDFLNNPDNKITQTIKLGGVTMVGKWLPDYRKNKENDPGYSYFNVRIEKPLTEKIPEGQALYLEFDIAKDFVLVNGKDSILPAIAQRIQNGVSGRFEYLVAFPESIRQFTGNDHTLVYNDKIFGLGTVAFLYKKEDTNKLPL